MEADRTSMDAPACPGCARRDRRIAELESQVAQLQDRIAKLEEQLAAATRGAKRQAAPFSKGPPKINPKTPGRKSGKDCGPKAFRPIPPVIDETYQAPLPKRCPCGGVILLAHLFGQQRHLFTYLRIPGIDATNYRAEQALKGPIVNRKVWGGNRTEDGAAAQGIISGVLGTLAKKALRAIDWISGLLRAPADTPLLVPIPGG